MNKSIQIPDEIFNRLLNEVKYDCADWYLIMHGISFELNLPEDLDLKRKVAFQVAERLLIDPGIVVIREKLGEGTEVWNFNPKEVLTLLKKDSISLYEKFPPRNGEYEIAFIDRNKIENLKKSRSRPITIIEDSSLIKP